MYIYTYICIYMHTHTHTYVYIRDVAYIHASEEFISANLTNLIKELM